MSGLKPPRPIRQSPPGCATVLLASLAVALVCSVGGGLAWWLVLEVWRP